MTKMNEYLTIRKAARFLGIAPNTLRNWERGKKITPYRNPLNRYRLYCKDELEKLLDDIKLSKK